jgi:hypothetical protein
MKITFKLNPDIVNKSHPGHKGIPGHQGGSAPKGQGGGTAKKKPYAGTVGHMNFGKGVNANILDAGESGDYWLPAKQSALRELASPDASNMRNELEKVLGWSPADYKDNTMQLMGDIQEEINTYGFVKAEELLPNLRDYYVDTDSMPDTSEDSMSKANDVFFNWGKKVIQAYKRNVRGANLAPSADTL